MHKLWHYLKEIFEATWQTPAACFRQMTPDFLAAKRAKLDAATYASWLKRKYAYLAAIAMEKRYENQEVPQSWIDALVIIEREIENLKRQGQTSLFYDIHNTAVSRELAKRA